MKYPVIIKPARLGSSIGIVVAKNEMEAKEGLETAFALDDRVIIEKYLANKQDVNCAVYMRGEEIIVSEPELAFGDGVYTFEEKYIKRMYDLDKKEEEKRGNNVAEYAGNKIHFSQNAGGRYALNMKKEYFYA